MPFWFSYVVLGVFALTTLAVAILGIRDELRLPARWRRRTGAATAVGLGALAFCLAISQVTGTWGQLCGSAVGILTYTPNPATQALDEPTRAAYEACFNRRLFQMLIATVLLIVSLVILFVSRGRALGKQGL